MLFPTSGMTSLEEVWGSAFPKKDYNMTSKDDGSRTKRDPEREGRVYQTPLNRTNAAIQRNKKSIDDLSKSLPIIENDEEAESNYHPTKISHTKENFTSRREGYANPYDVGANFSYAPPEFQEAAYDVKLDRIMRMIEQNKTGYETPSSQDMLLYIFTGVFFLFSLDSFVHLGKRMK